MLQAYKSDQLEQVVHQMRGDLQQTTQLLEHTGGAVHEQASLNQQLQQQMQQVSSACHLPALQTISICNQLCCLAGSTVPLFVCWQPIAVAATDISDLSFGLLATPL